jgi:hypothetical protein
MAPEKLKEVVIKYLEENPENMECALPPRVVAAFSDAYPCMQG